VTDAAFILSVLEDGEKHTQADLLRRSFTERGCGLTVHSRIADLRKQGHYVICERVPGADRGHAWAYQLVASSPTPPLSDAPLPLEDGKHDHDHVGRGGAEEESEQPSLFTFPRSPSWG
jgi:hypothetical protein